MQQLKKEESVSEASVLEKYLDRNIVILNNKFQIVFFTESAKKIFNFNKNKSIFSYVSNKKSIFSKVTKKSKFLLNFNKLDHQFPTTITKTNIKKFNYILDITSDNKTENNLVQLIENIHTPTYIVNDKNLIIAWNNSIAKLTGSTKKEIISKGNLSKIFFKKNKPLPSELLTKNKIQDLSKYYTWYEILENTSNSSHIDIVSDCELKNGKRTLHITSSIYEDETSLKKYVVVSINDLTKERTIEKKFKNSEMVFEAAFEENHLPTVILNKNHEITVWNKAMEHLTGLPKVKMLGTKDGWKAFYDKKRPILADLVLDKKEHHIAKHYPKSKLKKTGSNNEGYQITSKVTINGVEKFILFTASTIKNNENKNAFAIETILDISDSKKIEEELKIFNMTIRQSTDGIAITDTENKIIFVNDAWLKMHSRKLSSTSTIKEFFNKKQQKKEFIPFLNEVKRHGFFSNEINHITDNDGILPTLMSGSLINNQKGDIIAILYIARDIKEKKKAERQIQQLASFPEQNPDPILRINTDGILMYMNSSAEKLFKRFGFKVGLPLKGFHGDYIFQSIPKKIFRVYVLNKVIHFKALKVKFDNIINLYGLDITENVKEQKKLQEKMNELQKFRKITIQRELRMMELKKENERLLKKIEKLE